MSDPMLEPKDLSPAQVESLRRVMEARKALAESSPSPRRKKRDPIDRDEYFRRLREDSQEDEKLFTDLRKQRIDASLREWEAKAGGRFGHAQIDRERLPQVAAAVEKRVANIKSRKSLHMNGLLLTGHLGVGKTWTGYAYIKRLIEEGLMQPSNVLAGPEINILGPIDKATFDREQKIRDLLDPKHKVIFIDEVGRLMFKSVESRHDIWSMLINHAYEKNIPIIITSNLSTLKGVGMNSFSADLRPGARQPENMMEAWIGDAAWDRLKYITGEDGRIVPGNENMRGFANQQLG